MELLSNKFASFSSFYRTVIHLQQTLWTRMSKWPHKELYITSVLPPVYGMKCPSLCLPVRMVCNNLVGNCVVSRYHVPSLCHHNHKFVITIIIVISSSSLPLAPWSSPFSYFTLSPPSPLTHEVVLCSWISVMTHWRNWIWMALSDLGAWQYLDGVAGTRWCARIQIASPEAGGGCFLENSGAENWVWNLELIFGAEFFI